MDTQTSLFETFMKEFCPPLDSSLVAALLVDIEMDNEGRRTSPTQAQINELRSTLRELASQADEWQLSEFSDLQLTSPTDATSSSSTPDFFYDYTDTSSSLLSETSVSSQDALNSQLRFLQTVLPNVSEKRLRDALTQAEPDGDEPDLWNVISNILTDEAIREQEERGLDGLDDVYDTTVVADLFRETTEPRKQNVVSSSKTFGKKSKRGYKIALVDIRQQQHHVRSPSSPKTSTSPWTVVISISEQLSNLIPSHPASYFQSYFHSPKYPTPYEAMRSALGAIRVTSSTSDAEDTAVLITLLDIMLPEYEGMLDSTRRSNFYSDLQLAINITRGHPDDALDLVRILRELDSDSMSGCMEMGIYHSPIQANSPSPSSSPSAVQSLRRVSDSPTEPPPILLPPNSKGKPPLSEKKRKLAESRWQIVPPKKVPHYHPTNLHVPSSTPGVNGGLKVKGGGNGSGKGGKGDDGELAEFGGKRIKEILRKRDMYFREAQRMWRKGNTKNRGGEVAMYYVERGRDFDELAKKEALNAARARVQAKRRASNEKDTIDLHGTTAAEAIVIVKEELEGTTYSASRPLKIITGRGLHSINKVSILKPKVQKALEEDGWSVGVREGGLIVRGRKAVV